MRLTASALVHFIGQLPRDRAYHYINPKNKGQIELVSVVYPEGPIYIRRYDPSRGENRTTAREESLSTQMLWRVANSFSPGVPLNIDRVLGASYNTRSVLESLLAHNPQFYFCYPGRIESLNASSKIRTGHKHLMWCPDEPHELGLTAEKQTNIVISEVPSVEAVYEALVVNYEAKVGIDIEIQRRHAQIQIALVEIGRQLGYRTWVAQNDQGITYRNQRLAEMDGVVVSLQQEKLIAAFEDAQRAARLIDCIWFRNSKFMPAVMEIEHSTGVTSGLTRMKSLQDAVPSLRSRYVIVAADEDRNKVIREANREQFRSLGTLFFPYSAVEELYALCQRRQIRGVTEEFLDCYMEPTTSAPCKYH